MPKSIKINGKIYTKTVSFSTKREAQSSARKKRKKGFLIRVIPYKSSNGMKYGLYKRGNEMRR